MTDEVLWTHRQQATKECSAFCVAQFGATNIRIRLWSFANAPIAGYRVKSEQQHARGRKSVGRLAAGHVIR